MDKQVLAYHRHMRRVAREAKEMDEREGMDPRPTPQELSEWTARAACGEAIEPVDVLRLLQEVRRLHTASLGMFDPVKVGQVVAQLQMERDQARRERDELEHLAREWLTHCSVDEALAKARGLT